MKQDRLEFLEIMVPLEVLVKMERPALLDSQDLKEVLDLKEQKELWEIRELLVFLVFLVKWDRWDLWVIREKPDSLETLVLTALKEGLDLQDLMGLPVNRVILV